jgi:tRNA(Arg) A34 adenosine deaminase TadA
MQSDRHTSANDPLPALADLMRHAIEACKRGIDAGQGPFGSAIASTTGEIVAVSHNTVRSSCDATAHAEINAIREACAKLGTIDLSGHVIAATCEPCPMCASAIHWARLDAVCYGASIADAGATGFNELKVPVRSLYRDGGGRVVVYPDVLRDECLELFECWKQGPSPTPY